MRGTFTWKRVLGMALALVILFVLLAVLRLPAAFAWRTFLADNPAPTQFQLHDLSGTVWHGRAGALHYGKLQAGPLRWELAMLPLLWGEVSARVHLTTAGGFAEGGVSLDGNEINLDATRFHLPMSLFAPFLYGSPFVPAGDLSGSVAQAVIVPGEACQLEGELLWQSPGVAGIDGMGLGDIQLEMAPDAKGTRGLLRDRGGSLGVDGTLLFDAACRYRLDARLTPRGDISDPLRRMLSFAGRADAQGRYRLKLQGQLPLR